MFISTGFSTAASASAATAEIYVSPHDTADSEPDEAELLHFSHSFDLFSSDEDDVGFGTCFILT